MFGVRHLVKRHKIEKFFPQRQEQGDLSGNGHCGALRLLETSANSTPVFDDCAGVVIQPGAEPGEGFELLKLCIRQFEVSRHSAVGGPLCFSPNAGNGFTDIDSRQHP